MGPSERVIEYVNATTFRLSRIHHLDVDSIRWVVTSFDAIKKIFHVVIRLFAC